MKKILMSMVALFATVTMNAQVYVGGGVGFQKKGDAQTFTIAPEVGMSLDEKFGVGLQFGYTNVKDTYTQCAVNPYLRYQALEIGKAKVFVDGGAYFNTKKLEGADKSSNAFGLNVAPGVAFNLTDHISIVAKANNLFVLDFSKEAGDDDTRTIVGLNTLNNFSAGDLMFGFYYNF